MLIARPIPRTLVSLMIGVSALALSMPCATAQQGQQEQSPRAVDEANSVDELVITANRREQRLQDVGISVTAVGGNLLEQQNLTRAEQLDRLAPGLLAVPDAGSSISVFTLRGVGQSDFSPHQEQPIAIYRDGAYVAAANAVGLPLFDLQQVEVLRGPQSTLFGRNATGGVIQFLSNRASSDFSASAEGTYGNRNLGRFQGHINGRLLNNVDGRFSLYYQGKDGFVENLDGDNLQGEEVIAARAQLRFDNGTDTRFTFRAEGFLQDGTSYSGKSIPSFFDDNGVSQFLPPTLDVYGTGPGNDIFGFRDTLDDLTERVNTPGEIRKDVGSLSGTFERDFGAILLTSITSYARENSRYFEDTDGTPLPQTFFEILSDSGEFTQEIRLQEAQGKFRWTAGAYYLDIDGDFSVFFDLPVAFEPFFTGGAPTTGARYTAPYSLRTQSYAFFGQGEYDFTDKLTFILGGRFTRDILNYSYQGFCTQTNPLACGALFGNGVGNLASDGTPIIGDLGLVQLRQSNSDWSGKAEFDYQLNNNTLFYVSASKGLKAPGFSASADGLISIDQTAFGPERLFAYEAGVKASFFDRRLTANASGYYYDYFGFQTFQFSGTSTVVVNQRARTRGGEIELQAKPGWGVNINAGVAYSNFVVDDIVTPTAPQGERQRPANTPDWLANWTATKSFEVSSGLDLNFLYSGRYTGSRFYNIVNSPVVFSGNYTTHDTSLTLESKKGWHLSVWANNFTDTRYVTFSFDLTGLGYSSVHFAESRSFGITAGFSY